MPSADFVLPARMSRVAVVSPKMRVRAALVELARAGCVELVGNLGPAEGEEAEALHRLAQRKTVAVAAPALLSSAPDVQALEQAQEHGLLAGEVELKRRERLAVDHGSFAAWIGWAPTAELGRLNERLRAYPGRSGRDPMIDLEVLGS